MSQRQTDTQNTLANIPPVWKTVGMNQEVTTKGKYPQEEKKNQRQNTPQSLTTDKCK